MPVPSPFHTTPAERRALAEAERSGEAFLVTRDRGGAQRIVLLAHERDRITIGRREGSGVALPWDDRVSRIHAEIERMGEEWAISDDGLSRNGTFVNEVRITSKRRLRDGDVIRVGHTTILFRRPGVSEPNDETAPGSRSAGAPPITDAQARVLAALCRPCLESGRLVTPATNEAIAAELFLSVDAVKAHLRQLFRRFEVDELPQIQKRTALVRIAIESGVARRSP
jgi:DNA-binding CsgD family transcriptional regulator